MCHPRAGRPTPYLTPNLSCLDKDIEVGQESHIQVSVQGEFIFLECPFVDQRSLYVLFNN